MCLLAARADGKTRSGAAAMRRQRRPRWDGARPRTPDRWATALVSGQLVLRVAGWWFAGL